MKVYMNGQGHMTKMAAMAINSKDLLLQNQKAYDFETWHEASGRGALQSVYKQGSHGQGKVREKIKKVQGQGKVREFCFWSGKFEIFTKVREKSGNCRIKSQTIFFSDDNYSSKSINSNDFQLLGELCYS